MTTRAWLRVAVVVLVTVVLQEGVLNGIVIGGAHPDAFIVLAVAAGLTAGAQRGAVIAFAVGLVADLFVLTPYGVSALVYVLIAFVVGSSASLLSGRPPRSFQLMMGLAGGIVGTLLFAIIDALLGQPRLPDHEVAVASAVVGLGCVVLILPAVLAMSWAITPAPAREAVPASGGSAAR
jgi:rod shape-determining protein MreD